jgi:hypothetical protein
MLTIQEAVQRVIGWIDQAEDQALLIEGSYANGGRARRLHWMKNTLLTVPTEGLQGDLLDHWIGTGALPRDLFDLQEESLNEE